MRTTTITFLALSAALLFGCETAGDAVSSGTDGADSDAVDTSGLESRTFNFTYEATIPAPAGTKLLRVWAPLPREIAGVQEVADLELIGPDGVRQTQSADFGNRFAYAEVADPSEGVTIGWKARITRYEDRGQEHSPMNDRYLAETRYIPINGDAKDEADRQVEKLHLREAGLSDRDKAKRIYDDVLGDMEYNKKVPGYGNGDFMRAITVCKGNCTDFHSRFIGVARRAGLPARFTMGIPMKDAPEGTYNSYHCWAHWYDKASGTWQPVDISEADKIVATDPEGAERFFGHQPVHRVSMTFGRDLQLEPKQAGGPLNYMVFPYAEADGAPLKLSKDMWTFTYKNVG